MSSNPVFQYTRQRFPEGYGDATACGLAAEPDDKWYFWTETWADVIGPYETEEAADFACAEYASQL
jgi:hypothetical protein